MKRDALEEAATIAAWELYKLQPATGRQLSDVMVSHGFEKIEAQRAIQLCIDRGTFRLTRSLKLELAPPTGRLSTNRSNRDD